MWSMERLVLVHVVKCVLLQPCAQSSHCIIRDVFWATLFLRAGILPSALWEEASFVCGKFHSTDFLFLLKSFPETFFSAASVRQMLETEFRAWKYLEVLRDVKKQMLEQHASYFY